MLCGWDSWRPGAWGEVPQGLDIHPFLLAEVHRSLSAQSGEDAAQSADADGIARRIVDVLGQSRNVDSDDPDAAQPANVGVGVDGLMLARFLANPEEG